MGIRCSAHQKFAFPGRERRPATRPAPMATPPEKVPTTARDSVAAACARLYVIPLVDASIQSYVGLQIPVEPVPIEPNHFGYEIYKGDDILQKPEGFHPVSQPLQTLKVPGRARTLGHPCPPAQAL